MKPEIYCFPINELLNYVVFLTSIPLFPQDEGAPARCGVSAWEWVSRWTNLPDFEWELLIHITSMWF